MASPRSDVETAGSGGSDAARAVPPILVVSLGVCATGGPLALVGLFVPQAVSSRSSIGLVGLVGGIAFLLPLLIWYRYSASVASPGGLFSFVEAASNRGVARAQGVIWTVSYCLYLPFTVAYVVYDLLPTVLPSARPERAVLEIALPVALIVVMSLPVRCALAAVGVLAAGQLVVLAVWAATAWSHSGVPASSLDARGAAIPLLKGAGNFSLLFVCVSLPLFLGGEISSARSNPNRAMQRSLVLAFAIVAVGAVGGSLVWALAPARALTAEIPGVALARSAGGHSFGTLVGLVLLSSIVGVMAAEYLALTRLLHAMSSHGIRRTNAVVAAGFLATSAVSLVNPEAFYRDLIKPSLIALWIAQLIVVAVYPNFERRRGRPVLPALALAVGSGALMGYGLYTAVTMVTS